MSGWDVVEKRLNSADLLPASAFRRNHEIYALVSYVNCLLGCRMAGNDEGENLFKGRIARYVASHAPKPDEFRYYQHVASYIDGAAALPAIPVGTIKSFGPFGPKYEVGQAIRQLDDGDWMVEVTMVETGKRAEYRLIHLADDPEAY